MKYLVAILMLFFICRVNPAYAIIDIVSIKNCSSSDACDGEVTAAAIGNAGPFTFLWSNGSKLNTASNLCPGSYTVTVTNRIDCSIVLVAYVNVCQPFWSHPITISEKIYHASRINASDGAVELALNYDSYQFTSVYYYWTGPNGFASASNNISNVPPGTYHLSVTNGCTSVEKTIVVKTEVCTLPRKVISTKIASSILPHPLISKISLEKGKLVDGKSKQTPECIAKNRVSQSIISNDSGITADTLLIYPNPNGGSNVTVTVPYYSRGRIRVFMASGQLQAEYKVDQERQFPLDCSNWPNGVYVVTFAAEGSQRPMVARLVVCR